MFCELIPTRFVAYQILAPHTDFLTGADVTKFALVLPAEFLLGSARLISKFQILTPRDNLCSTAWSVATSIRTMPARFDTAAVPLNQLNNIQIAVQ